MPGVFVESHPKVVEHFSEHEVLVDDRINGSLGKLHATDSD